jgi:hypothetical protein
MTQICEALGCRARGINFTHWQGNEMACRATVDTTTFLSISWQCLAMKLITESDGSSPQSVEELRTALNQPIGNEE